MSDNVIPKFRSPNRYTMMRQFVMMTDDDFICLLDAFKNSVYYWKGEDENPDAFPKNKVFKSFIDALYLVQSGESRRMLLHLAEDSSAIEMSISLVRMITNKHGSFNFPYSIEGGVNEEDQNEVHLRFHGLCSDTPDELLHFWNGWADNNGDLQIG